MQVRGRLHYYTIIKTVYRQNHLSSSNRPSQTNSGLVVQWLGSLDGEWMVSDEPLRLGW